MIDPMLVEKARQVDLLSLMGKDTSLHCVSRTRGGEYAGACPFCGGRDRLRVQPAQGRWWCRQCIGSQTNQWQDAITYVIKRDNISFVQAVQSLVDGTLSANFRPAQSNSAMVQIKEQPSAQWQTNALSMITECERLLWSDRGTGARDWLHQRGLNDTTLHEWRIGYNPTGRRIGGMWVDTGILIPCIVDRVVWYIKVSLLAGHSFQCTRCHKTVTQRGPCPACGNDNRYRGIRGNRAALFGAPTLGQHDYAVFTEGEFDAMLTWQCLQHSTNSEWGRIGVATLGSATNSFDLNVWARYLWPVGRYLVCYDSDAAGQQGLAKWTSFSARTRCVTVPKLKPTDKDLTDFHSSGGRILDLIVYEIARDRYQRERTMSTAADPVPSAPASSSSASLEVVQQQWNDLMDRLDQLQAQGQQDTAEFEHIFGEWELVDQTYRQLCDCSDGMELTVLVRANTNQ